MRSRKYISLYILSMMLIGLAAATAAHAESPDYGNNCLSAHSIFFTPLFTSPFGEISPLILLIVSPAVNILILKLVINNSIIISILKKVIYLYFIWSYIWQGTRVWTR